MNIDSNTIALVIVALAPPIVEAMFAQDRNIQKLIIYFVIAAIILFRPLITKLVVLIPDKLKLIKTPLLKIINFFRSPIAQKIFFAILVIWLILTDQLITKIVIGIYLFLMYYFGVNRTTSNLPWTQGKKPMIQDNFNTKLENWETLFGEGEIEQTFGNPAPDVVLKQMGHTSATPQTFLVLKTKKIENPATIECDVYIEPRGIFNLVFGINKEKTSYFMARLDTRETEFDAFLYKKVGEGWNFVTRSDKTRSAWKTWHRVKLEILSEKKASIYKDGELILTREFDMPIYGFVGIMNEDADVHVDNFTITN